MFNHDSSLIPVKLAVQLYQSYSSRFTKQFCDYGMESLETAAFVMQAISCNDCPF